jgi:hypothetical protein
VVKTVCEHLPQCHTRATQFAELGVTKEALNALHGDSRDCVWKDFVHILHIQQLQAFELHPDVHGRLRNNGDGSMPLWPAAEYAIAHAHVRRKCGGARTDYSTMVFAPSSGSPACGLWYRR